MHSSSIPPNKRIEALIAWLQSPLIRILIEEADTGQIEIHFSGDTLTASPKPVHKLKLPPKDE